MTADSLAMLRDIHLPAPVSPWPPAPGWWLVGLVVLAAGLAAIILLLRAWHQRRRYRVVALRELRHLGGTAGDRAFVEQVAGLLKRVAIKRFGRQQVARLSGEEWLRFLDRTGRTNQFTRGVGRVLGEELYRGRGVSDPEQLGQLVATWIRDHRLC